MLELKDIRKDYPAGSEIVHALRGISLKFRTNEFVSILGPSGCGKTTMLNIIGGLDQYTEGDLVINGRSTKDFKDRDWDSYRNHSIGFVFQSYNLIPHQTVLRNVELALTLSGVSKSERTERAKKALEQVGLGDQLKKRPSEMSGGQMQRVAIARALVNDPDIILADEPTGALDTETSVQVMEILKKISENKLIIMVTHNPELAEKYSSRIIRVLDGQITDDSAPLTESEVEAELKSDAERSKSESRQKKPSMSFATAFGLSLKNLLTKKGRTILTSFAGSIGIIGIALILSLSEGVTAYINDVQEESLASYPLTIESKVMDFSSLFETMMGKSTKSQEHPKDAVYTRPIFADLVNSMSASNQKSNDLKAFKEYIENERADENSDLHKALSAVQYSYKLDISIYTHNTEGKIVKADPNKLMQDIMSESMGVDMSTMTEARDSYLAGTGNMFSVGVDLMSEMLPDSNGEGINKLITDNYELVYGSYPKEYNEVVLILDKNNELNDLALYALGLKSHDDMKKMMDAAMNQTELEYDDRSWSYEDICGKEYRMIINSDCYKANEDGIYLDMRDSDTGMKYLYDNGIDLKISGIIRPLEDNDTPMLQTAIGYTTALTKYVVKQSEGNEAIAAQLADKTVDIFTGMTFKADAKELTQPEKAAEFKSYAEELPDTEKAALYADMMSAPTEEELSKAISDISAMSEDDMVSMFMQMVGEQITMDEGSIRSYLDSMSEDEFKEMLSTAMKEQITNQKKEMIGAQLASLTAEQVSATLDETVKNADETTLAGWYDNAMPHNLSDSTYEYNLEKLGYVDLDEPSRISLYSSTFENKDLISSAIESYNNGTTEDKQITYTDYIGIMLSSVTTIINAISYVLIAFVSISLVVSSIMIGVITLISVQERTKEIGILRAIGASKKDVSSMFNAETMIIGFTSGLIGVIVTYLLCIPINIIIHNITDIMNLNAFLPVPAAALLILISILLTLISGLIPSRSAAKKDPVVALRTE
ncbi:putative ABC transport system permease protein [Ruminococcus sp. YE71]|uniref:ABC transporter ATP-binding protein/permease n=1 Tax=unclassified Ruminococcus TaxID=2608920 RepID=UPI00088EED73|nr:MULTISPECIES: ABC transporter ATP-binding protein/permease [unclassified Ruminococcus]SDA24167.1 putative ABC transport system permease protein [Ruminococcus sp. YE78]SFW41472.1 putative ABC transport system permease protein [Ruminococcus sp. YE71]